MLLASLSLRKVSVLEIDLINKEGPGDGENKMKR